ncbi:hypothetical protein RJT34_15011 [Clitoria ternatea]|uniref:Uncharacterized protein n=1 Tax=Clitoria ternatea TaxID=43366 RepID=A0AAN9JU09_CLITE
MDSGGGSKLTGIRQIVRLKEMLQKWQNVTLGSKTPDHSSHNATDYNGSLSPLINKRIVQVRSCEDSDEESCQTPEPLPPPDVPKGYLAVYVGPELRRFIIPTSYLSHHLFKVLLEKAADEYGFDQSGGLTIPCEIETFKYLLKCIENEENEKKEQSARKLFVLIWNLRNCGRVSKYSDYYCRSNIKGWLKYIINQIFPSNFELSPFSSDHKLPLVSNKLILFLISWRLCFQSEHVIEKIASI